MNIKRIEEMIEEFENLFKFDGVTYKGNRHWREDIKRNLVSNWINKALKEAHQAGKDDVVEKIDKLRQPFKVSENMELRESYNQALDDIIKALQDNK